MLIDQMLKIWPGSQILSVVIWVIVLNVLMYFARKPFHREIRSFCIIIYKALRISSLF